MTARASGRFWPWFVGLLLAGTAGAQGVLLWAATHDSAFAIEPDYYKKAVAWDSTMARQRANAALGWTATARFDREASRTTLRVGLRDSASVAIDSARVRVTAVHNLSAATPLQLSLRGTGSGEYVVELPPAHAGMWELRIEALARGHSFTPSLRAELPAR